MACPPDCFYFIDALHSQKFRETVNPYPTTIRATARPDPGINFRKNRLKQAFFFDEVPFDGTSVAA